MSSTIHLLLVPNSECLWIYWSYSPRTKSEEDCQKSNFYFHIRFLPWTSFMTVFTTKWINESTHRDISNGGGNRFAPRHLLCVLVCCRQKSTITLFLWKYVWLSVRVCFLWYFTWFLLSLKLVIWLFMLLQKYACAGMFWIFNDGIW